MATRMQQRRGTASQWTTANPILAAGEIGFETDTGEFRVGDGTNHWADLSPFKNLLDLGGSLDDYILLSEKATADGVATLDGTGNVPVSQLQNLIDGAPGTLDTLNEISDALLAIDGQVATAIDAAIVIEVGNRDGAISAAVLGLQGDITDLSNAVALDITNLSNAVALDITDLSNAVALDITNSISTAIADDVVDRDAAIATAKGEAIADAASYTDSEIADEVTARNSAIATAKSGAEITAQGYVSDHAADTTSVHGIADTSVLATATTVATAKSEAITAAGTAADTKISTAVAALTKTSVGLSNVDNTSDANKPVSSAQATAIATAKSEAISDATSQVNALIAGAPGALNTLDELAAALGDDANFATTVTNSLAAKAPLAGPTFTGLTTVSASGIAFTDGTQTKEGVPSRTPIVQKTASYTLSELSERDTLIEVNSASGTTVTIPLNSAVAYPVGTSIDVLQTGAGQVTIGATGGVTINATPGFKLRTQWSSATLFKRATDTWVIFGDLTA